MKKSITDWLSLGLFSKQSLRTQILTLESDRLKPLPDGAIGCRNPLFLATTVKMPQTEQAIIRTYLQLVERILRNRATV